MRASRGTRRVESDIAQTKKTGHAMSNRQYTGAKSTERDASDAERNASDAETRRATRTACDHARIVRICQHRLNLRIPRVRKRAQEREEHKV